MQRPTWSSNNVSPTASPTPANRINVRPQPPPARTSTGKKGIARPAASLAGAGRGRTAAPVGAGGRTMTGTLTAWRSEARLVDRHPEPVPADHLVVGQTSLQMLGDHVDVLEVALD